MTLRQEQYREFLSTVFWADLSEECKRRDGGRCRYCRSKHILQAHHTIYPQDWYQTTLDHLITLCRKCHEAEHGIKPKDAPQSRFKKQKTKFPKRQKKTPHSNVFKPRTRFPMVEIVDYDTLMRARTFKQISRRKFLELRDKFPAPSSQSVNP